MITCNNQFQMFNTKNISNILRLYEIMQINVTVATHSERTRIVKLPDEVQPDNIIVDILTDLQHGEEVKPDLRSDTEHIEQ